MPHDTADRHAPPITAQLARLVATHPSRGWGDAVEVVSGVNLSMLIKFANMHTVDGFDETVRRTEALLAPGTGERPLGRRFVDDAKVTDHHAIIPTTTSPFLRTSTARRVALRSAAGSSSSASP